MSTTSCSGYAEAPGQSSSTLRIDEANRLALSGSSSSVSVEGVVVNDLRDFAGQGFYLQAPKSHFNGVPNDGDRSQAIFVYCRGSCSGDDFEEGDFVTVDGRLGQFGGNPQITQPSVELVEDAKFKPSTDIGNCPALAYDVNIVDVSLPLSDFDELEKFTGMLLHFTSDLTITNTFSLQYGELGLSSGRLINPTMTTEPASEEYYDLVREQALNYIGLDDVSSATCPVPQLYFDPSRDGVRSGWSLPSAVLDATTVAKFFEVTDKWILTPTAAGRETIPLNYDKSSNPRVENLSDVIPVSSVTERGLRIGSMNMLNYFTSLGCSSCRGADNAAEFSIQSKKLYAALSEMDAAVVGLEEVQNDGGDRVLEFLVDELNEFVGERKYDFISTGEVGRDAIRNAIIYQPSQVQPVGSYAVKTFNNPSDKSRPSLAQTFRLNSPACSSNSDKFTFVVNHLKSKGSSCSEDSSGNGAVDGEANCGYTRLKHAQQLMEWLESDPTDSNSDSFMLVGDFNSYKEERAIKELTGNGYVNLGERDVPASSLYSLTFDGFFGTLDYMIASPSLAAKCRNTLEWHINADEPIITDYNDEQYSYPSACETKPPSYTDELSFFRSSDHDPIVTFCSFECSGVAFEPKKEAFGSLLAFSSIFAILVMAFAGLVASGFIFKKHASADSERKDMHHYTL